MIPQYTAASLVSHNKQLCTPQAPTTPTAATARRPREHGGQRRLENVEGLGHAEQVLAIEAMCAAQASDFRSSDVAMAPALAGLQTSFREVVPFWRRTRSWLP